MRCPFPVRSACACTQRWRPPPPPLRAGPPAQAPPPSQSPERKWVETARCARPTAPVPLGRVEQTRDTRADAHTLKRHTHADAYAAM